MKDNNLLWVMVAAIVAGACAHAGGAPIKDKRVELGTDFAELVIPPERVPGDPYARLKGSYSGTTFSIDLDHGLFAGMAHFPEAIAYGENPKLIWVRSYYRYFSGIDLIDVSTGEGVFAAHGRAPELSPDHKRVAYIIDGVYGLVRGVGLNDYVVYPRVQQIKEMPSRSNPGVIAAGLNTPEMEMEKTIKWLDSDSFCFVIYENPRAAELAKLPELERYYLVQVDGAGEGFSRNTLEVSRARLGKQTVERLRENDSATDWDYRTLAAEVAGALKPVRHSDWEPDVFDDPEWPILPLAVDGEHLWTSPNGLNTVTAELAGIYTDTKSGVNIRMNGILVVSVRELREDVANIESPIDPAVVGPTSRLLTSPLWKNDDQAEILIQSDWVPEALLSRRETTKYWKVTVKIGDNSGLPTVEKTELTREAAKTWLRIDNGAAR